MDLLLQKIMELAQELAKAEQFVNVTTTVELCPLTLCSSHEGVHYFLWTMIAKSWWPKSLTLPCLMVVINQV